MCHYVIFCITLNKLIRIFEKTLNYYMWFKGLDRMRPLSLQTMKTHPHIEPYGAYPTE